MVNYCSSGPELRAVQTMKLDNVHIHVHLSVTKQALPVFILQVCVSNAGWTFGGEVNQLIVLTVTPSVHD